MLTENELEDMGHGAPKNTVVATVAFNGDAVLLGEDRKKGRFSMPTGCLEAGEAPEDCSLRVVREETGISCENPIIISIYDAYEKEERMHHITVGAMACYQSGNIIEEGLLRWNWYAIKDILRFELSKTDKIHMEHFLYHWRGKQYKETYGQQNT